MQKNGEQVDSNENSVLLIGKENKPERPETHTEGLNRRSEGQQEGVV